MSNETNNEESMLSVRTPWGNLVKAQGIQSILDSLKEDLNSFNKRLREIERIKAALPAMELPGQIEKKLPFNDLEDLKNSLISLTSRVDALANEKSSLNQSSALESFTKSLARSFETLKSDFIQLNTKIQELERNKPKLPTPDEAVTKVLSAFETRIIMVENRMRDLEAKFEKFSAKTIQILEQLRK